MSRDSSLFTSSLHPSPEPFHGGSDIVERLRSKTGQIGPSPDQLLAFMTGIRPLILESAAEIERLRRELDRWSAQVLKEDDCRVGWQKRALTAESLLAAAWENAAKIAETTPMGMENHPQKIAAALRAAGKEVSERNSTQKDGSR